MKFIETKLNGAYLIELELINDERGFFARNFCIEEFKKSGIDFEIVQCNVSYNKKAGTLRGMHYQTAPHEEAKLVSCTKGRIYDVIIDLRKDLSTYCQWFAVELTAPSSPLPAHSSEIAHSSPLAAPCKMLYIPKGFAHGFQTLENDSVVFYQMSEFYHPESSRGVRWNDSAFNIEWPLSEKIMSEKDMAYQDFKR